MKQNLTHITFIIDKSGSMESRRQQIVGGFNEFVDAQRKEDGEATVSIIQFSSLGWFGSDEGYVETVLNKDIKNIKPMTLEDYVPSGGTALFDAIGKTISNLGRDLAGLNESLRPSKVMIVIMTDGEENSSREYDSKSVGGMITRQKNEYSWEFMFVGSDQNSVLMAKNLLNIDGGLAVAVDNNWKKNMEGITRSVSSYRCGEERSVYSQVLNESVSSIGHEGELP